MIGEIEMVAGLPPLPAQHGHLRQAATSPSRRDRCTLQPVYAAVPASQSSRSMRTCSAHSRSRRASRSWLARKPSLKVLLRDPALAANLHGRQRVIGADDETAYVTQGRSAGRCHGGQRKQAGMHWCCPQNRTPRKRENRTRPTEWEWRPVLNRLTARRARPATYCVGPLVRSTTRPGCGGRSNGRGRQPWSQGVAKVSSRWTAAEHEQSTGARREHEILATGAHRRALLVKLFSQARPLFGDPHARRLQDISSFQDRRHRPLGEPSHRRLCRLTCVDVDERTLPLLTAAALNVPRDAAL